ncbi:MAG TPA: hypothetical protein VJH24_05705 [Candidatus Bilamarchaeaceae archaeon]|nr:hypothetical protein [Candidatus Bilamarchaeaceae archaeon]
MRSITVVAEDRVGLLADISYILGKSSVNIESLGVDIVGDKAIIALSVRDFKRAAHVLTSNGFAITQHDALVIKLPNRPGELNKLADHLAGEQISVQNMHLLSNDKEHGVFAVFVDKPRKAMRLLAQRVLNGSVNGSAEPGVY